MAEEYLRVGWSRRTAYNLVLAAVREEGELP